MSDRPGWRVARTAPLLVVTVLQLLGPLRPQSGAEAVECRAETERIRKAPILILSYLDPNRLFPDGRESVMRQTNAIFSEAGVSIDWSTQEAGQTSEVVAFSLRILLVESEPASWELPPTAMGAILSRTAPQRTAYIFFPAVLRALGFKAEILMKRPLSQREKWEVARALSRVIAHEIVHAVVPSMPHARDGLTRLELDRDQLLHPNGIIHPDVANRFRRELICLSPALTQLVSVFLFAPRTERQGPA